MNKLFAPVIFLSFGLIILAFNLHFVSNKTDITIPLPNSEPDLVSNYYFYQSMTGYTPISTGTVIATGFQDDSTYGNIPIGFTFNYNNTNYSVIGISDNGWVQLGAISPPTHYISPMICSAYVTPVICPFNADMLGNIADTLRYMTTGLAPNRCFTIEWCHWGFHPYGNNEMNFELNLFETSNIVQFVYQPLSPSSTINIQVGLMGQSSSDYFTRTETSSWASTTVGTACAYCYYSSNVVPLNGLTFTFSPNPLGIKQKSKEIPTQFKLYNNFPNPFNPVTTIRFDLPKAANVKLILYNMLGQEINILIDRDFQAGAYSVTWDGTNYPSGVYLDQLSAGDFIDSKKMILTK